MSQPVRNTEIRISVDIAAIALVVGMLPILFLPQLPSPPVLAGIAFVTLLLWWQRRHRGCLPLCCLLLGFIFATGSASLLMRQVETLITDGNKNVIASVTSVRLEGAARAQVQFRIEQVNGQWLVPAVSFTANGADERLCAGQRWAMKVRFRPVHSSLNEGGGRRATLGHRQSTTPAWLHSLSYRAE